MANKEFTPKAGSFGRPVRPAGDRVRDLFGRLFPQAPAVAAPPAPRVRRVAIQVAVVAAGVVVLLLRVPGIPAWDSAYAEDWAVFLPSALASPWRLFLPYDGYEQLGPRLIGQLVATFLPIMRAAEGFAIAGALVAAACALFMYHASDGYIRSRWLRAILGAALLLLPIAPLEIIDSGVNSPWYAMTATFFAVLWRPRGRAGMTASALVAFYACSSEIVAAVFAPLVIMRLIALPRWREHAVTAGWLAGLLIQVPVIADSYARHAQRMGGPLATPGQAFSFYLHGVVLPAFGWHLSLWLTGIAGYAGATVIVAVLLAAMTGAVLVAGGQRARVFAAAALITGLAEAMVTATITSWAGVVMPHPAFLPAARYATLPIVGITATWIVAADSLLARSARRGGMPARLARGRRLPVRAGPGMPAVIAALALACALGAGWIADYRYVSWRSTTAYYWWPYARPWAQACARNPGGQVSMFRAGVLTWNAPSMVAIPCARIRR